jgi:Cu2+-exporting ATPase
MLAAAGTLARHGVLVRRMQALESLAKIDTLIFDKTGTLTRDGQRITQVWTAEGMTSAQALQMAAALAQHSVHPLSRALVAEHQASGDVNALEMGEVHEVMGQGLEGKIEETLRLGSAQFCGAQRKGLPEPAKSIYAAKPCGWRAGSCQRMCAMTRLKPFKTCKPWASMSGCCLVIKLSLCNGLHNMLALRKPSVRAHHKIN